VAQRKNIFLEKKKCNNLGVQVGLPKQRPPWFMRTKKVGYRGWSPDQSAGEKPCESNPGWKTSPV